MADINPETLKKLRGRRTLDELAKTSGVDKQTIHRLEHGRIDRPRETTLKKLAKALRVEPERLTGSVSDEPASALAWEPNKSQLNLRISDQARNALLLVCERYHVRPAQVVELAPLLFNWAAEKSLRQRQECIDTLEQRESEISEQLERFSSDLGALSDGPPPPIELPDLNQFWMDQDCGLSYRYLFNNSEPEYVLAEDGGPAGYAGPIMALLDELASEIGDEAEFIGWDVDSSPTYRICKEEATWLANEDEVALENILQGYALLTELPKQFWDQLRNRNTLSLRESDEVDAIRRREAAERVRWLRAHGRPDDLPEVGS